MRTFRFRAFDKKEKVMIYGIENIYDGGYCVNSNNQEISIYSTSLSSSSFGNNLNNEDIEIMQFTGLFDRNGTPIYEGDLLADTGSDGNGGEIVYTLKEVVFHEGAFQMKELLDKEWGLEYMDDISHLEVLGNIYENPNLLERLINEKFYL